MRKLFDSALAGGKTTEVFVLDSIEEVGKRVSSLSSYIIITDTNTSLYSPRMDKTLVLESGEENKTWESIDRILSFALENNLARDSWFVAIGGGVVCDMTALASSLYMRGCHLILCPTTLLCMVDATLGGKSAIDYHGTKNLIGSFYPADEVLIASDTLSSLSDDDFLSGMGEVVKHALLASDDELYDELLSRKDEIMSRDRKELEKIVELSLLVKKDYIERDPKEEKGIRSALNFGHTFGHALESITHYSVSHGEAVVWGMEKALTSGLLLGITMEDFYLWAINLISRYPFKCNWKVKKEDYNAFLEATKKDKKKSGGVTRFVFLSQRGEPIMRPLSDDQVLALLI